MKILIRPSVLTSAFSGKNINHFLELDVIRKAIRLYISYKNDWPLCDERAVVIDMCAGLLERPNILLLSY